MKKQTVKGATTTATRKSLSRTARTKVAVRGPGTHDETQSPAAPKNLLTAGIKALSHAHEEAVARQSRVFESLLGLGARRDAEKLANAGSAPNPLAAALDPFGFKKFEDVFDQRVDRALQNLGAPSAEAFAALAAEVERLRAVVATLEASGRKR